jgi:hypothetical protein
MSTAIYYPADIPDLDAMRLDSILPRLGVFVSADGDLELGDVEELGDEVAEPTEIMTGRPMRPGDTHVAAAGLLVEKLSDVEWAVRDRQGEWTAVTEDSDGPGYLGEQWAIDAALEAEQVFDLGNAACELCGRTGAAGIHPDCAYREQWLADQQPGAPLEIV